MLLAAAPAHALEFNFQFQDVDGPLRTRSLVKGTLSGLVEGNNAGQGITATVSTDPTSIYNFASSTNGNAFTVSNGNITFADVSFINQVTGIPLRLGTTGNSGFTNFFFVGVDFADSTNSTTQFTAATPVPFEPNSVVGIATLGFCFGAAKVRKNHLAKKRMVSVEA